MKLDKKYFDCRLIDLLNCFSFRKHLNPEPNDGYKPELDILKQIARDAAEAQRERCFNVKFPCQQEGCTDCLNTLAIPDGE